MPSYLTSITEIYNRALALVGANLISTPDEVSKEAENCKLFWPGIRDALLMEHRWQFALKRVVPEEIADFDDEEWTHAYQLPNDFLRLDEISGVSEYLIQGNRILADDQPLLTYVARIEDVTQYDPLFVETAVYRLAAVIVVPLTGQTELVGAFLTLSNTFLAEARSIDSQQQVPRPIFRDIWGYDREA